MLTFFHAVESVTVILLLIAVGFVFARAGWIGDGEKRFISRYLMNLAIPCTCISGMQTYLTQEMLRSAGVLVLIPFLVCSSCVILSFLTAKLMKLPRKTFGVVVTLCAISNTFFIGYPLCIELFGQEATPYIMFYYVVSSLFTQLVGMSLIRWSGEAGVSPRKMVKKIVTMPSVLGAIAAVLLVYFNVKLPGVLASFVKYTGQSVTPLALLLSGQIIAGVGLKKLRPDRNMLVMLLFRFLIAPLICLGLCRFFGLESFPRSIYTIMAGLPVLTSTVVAATEYGADEACAARGIAVSTIAAFITIPIWMVLLT